MSHPSGEPPDKGRSTIIPLSVALFKTSQKETRGS
jgi:hypothetical protein